MPAYSLKLNPVVANVSYFGYSPIDPTERYNAGFINAILPEANYNVYSQKTSQISFSQIAQEFCQDTAVSKKLSLCYGGESGIPAPGPGVAIKFSDYYGAEFKILATCTTNGQAANLPGSLYTQDQLQRPNAKKITIGSGTFLSSTTTAPAANIRLNWKGRVIVDNYGLIIGKAGTSGSIDGGPALYIDSGPPLGNVTFRNYGQVLAGGGRGSTGGQGGDGEYYVTNPVAVSNTQFGSGTNYLTWNRYTKTGRWAYNSTLLLNEPATTGTLVRITTPASTDARITAASTSGYWFSYSQAQDHWYSVNGIAGLYLRIVAGATGLSVDNDYAPVYRGRYMQFVMAQDNIGNGYYVNGFTFGALSGVRNTAFSFLSSTGGLPTTTAGQIRGTRGVDNITNTNDGRLSASATSAWGTWDAGLHQPGQANFPSNRWTGSVAAGGHTSSWSLSLTSRTFVIATGVSSTDYFFGVNTNPSHWGQSYPAVENIGETYYGFVGTYDSGGSIYNGLGVISRSQNTAPTFTLTKSTGGLGGGGGEGYGGKSGGYGQTGGSSGGAGNHSSAGTGGAGGAGGGSGKPGNLGVLGTNGTILTGALTNGARRAVSTVIGAGGNSVISSGAYFQSNVGIINRNGNFQGIAILPAGSYPTAPWQPTTTTLTPYTMTPDNNNGGVMLTLGFNITMSGQTFDRIYFGTNGYISFHNAAAPTGTNTTTPGPTNPGRFGILFWPGDRTVSNFKAARIGTYSTYLLSFDMASSTVAGETAYFEISINGDINTVNVLMNTGERYQTPVFGGISNGQSYTYSGISGLALYPIYVGGYTSGYKYILPQ